MKVKELIEKLQKCDPEFRVFESNLRPVNFVYEAKTTRDVIISELATITRIPLEKK